MEDEHSSSSAASLAEATNARGGSTVYPKSRALLQHLIKSYDFDLQAQSLPPAILNMPLPKVQAALAKSLKNLKQRDQIINTLKKQLKSSSDSSQLPTSSPPQSIALEQATLQAQNELASANERAQAAEERIKELEKGMKDLVATSKVSGEAHSVQLQELQQELQSAKRFANECKDSKARNLSHHKCHIRHIPHAVCYGFV